MSFDPIWGDRRQELVIIGQYMDKAAVQKALEECLVTDEEMRNGLRDLSDPFEPWEDDTLAEEADSWLD